MSLNCLADVKRSVLHLLNINNTAEGLYSIFAVLPKPRKFAVFQGMKKHCTFED